MTKKVWAPRVPTSGRGDSAAQISKESGRRDCIRKASAAGILDSRVETGQNRKSKTFKCLAFALDES